MFRGQKTKRFEKAMSDYYADYFVDTEIVLINTTLI